MYAVRLTESGQLTRYLDNNLIFVYEIHKATLFSSTSDALQAIHSRGYQAAKQDWPTGFGTLAIVEVANAPSVVRTIA